MQFGGSAPVASARDATRPPLLGVLVMIGVTLESAMRFDMVPTAVVFMRIVWGLVHKTRKFEDIV